jgi:hypothetical protein
LSGPALERIERSRIERVFATNTIPLSEKAAATGRFTVLSVAELFDEGNIILLDGEGRIVKPLWHHRFRDREVVPGAAYTFPGKDCSDLSPGALGDLIGGSDREIVKTLAVDCMLGAGTPRRSVPFPASTGIHRPFSWT